MADLAGKTLVNAFRRWVISRFTKSDVDAPNLARLAPSSTNDIGMRSFTNDVAEQIDFLEIIEIAIEWDQLVAASQAAAVGASTASIYDLTEEMNKGQQVLATGPLFDAVSEYWPSVDLRNPPDPVEFQNQCYEAHYAIEQALSWTVDVAWQSGIDAGFETLAQGIGEIVLETGTSQLFDLFQHSPWRFREADLRNPSVTSEQWGIRDRYGRYPGDPRGYVGPVGSGWSQYGAERQLSLRAFMGINQPYWFTQSRSLQVGYLNGDLSYGEYTSLKSDLYRRTYRNPNSTSPPAGWAHRDYEYNYRGYGGSFYG